MQKDNQWWGYLHTSGTLQVKRYFEPRDIEEAEQSDFVLETYQPFYAANREDAIEHIRKTMTFDGER